MTLVDLASALSFVGHAGEGSTWQAMVVVAGVVLCGVGLATALGRLTLASPGDLVLPLAGTAIVASAAPLASDWLSDGIGWGLPLAVVWLTALLLAVLTPLEMRLPAPLPMGAIALAAVTAITLYPTLTRELHPPPEVYPLADDSQISISTPQDGATVDAGIVEVVVEVTGGTIGPGDVPLDELPEDPEEAGALAVVIGAVGDDGGVSQQQEVEVSLSETCTVEAPCTTATLDVEVGPGEYDLIVEFRRGDGTPLAPFVRDRLQFTAR